MNQVINNYQTQLISLYSFMFIIIHVSINTCMTEYFSRSSRCFEFEDNHATATCPAIGVASTSSSRLGCFKTNVVRQQSSNMLAYFIQANTTDNQLSMLQQLAINLKFYCILYKCSTSRVVSWRRRCHNRSSYCEVCSYQYCVTEIQGGGHHHYHIYSTIM